MALVGFFIYNIYINVNRIGKILLELYGTNLAINEISAAHPNAWVFRFWSCFMTIRSLSAAVVSIAVVTNTPVMTFALERNWMGRRQAHKWTGHLCRPPIKGGKPYGPSSRKHAKLAQFVTQVITFLTFITFHPRHVSKIAHIHLFEFPFCGTP